MASPVVHWEIGAADTGKVGAFYRELFDWQITPAGPEYSLVAGVDGGIGGGILQVGGNVPPYLTVYVQVEELETALRRAVALGGGVVVPPTTISGVGRFAMIDDPEGHTVGLLEAAPDEAATASVTEQVPAEEGPWPLPADADRS